MAASLTILQQGQKQRSSLSLTFRLLTSWIATALSVLLSEQGRLPTACRIKATIPSAESSSGRSSSSSHQKVFKKIQTTGLRFPVTQTEEENQSVPAGWWLTATNLLYMAVCHLCQVSFNEKIPE